VSVNERGSLLIGWGICGSFCTIARAAEMMENLIKDFQNLPEPIRCDVTPVVSFSVQQIDTRFGHAADIVARIEQICGRRCICTIEDAEPLGPKIKLDAFVIAPCTGNTLAKIARGINDTPVTMAVKAHLRNDSPTLIALASNDALSANLYSIAALLERKHVFFVPFGQDDPQGKPHSLVADFALLQSALISALEGKQLQPLLRI
jgi:dipicolinate synthase subunit B